MLKFPVEDNEPQPSPDEIEYIAWLKTVRQKMFMGKAAQNADELPMVDD